MECVFALLASDKLIVQGKRCHLSVFLESEFDPAFDEADILATTTRLLARARNYFVLLL